MKKIVMGFVAHVDAGKTTLSESMLYESGKIRKQGRVDDRSSFLDYDELERQRGITIYSKVSSFDTKDTHYTLIDTPGHIDFSGEMERALSVLDVAVLIISANDGVQSHTKTIWKLLRDYHIPTVIFVNKMDLSHYTQEELCDHLKQLSGNIVSLDDEEALAMCDDRLLDEYMNDGHMQEATIAQAIGYRHVFPVIFGSALKNEGTKELMDLLDRYTLMREDDVLSGIVYKIAHDDKGERLSFVRLSGGHLHVKDELLGEKINQMRQYNGEKYQLSEDMGPGDVCALTGLKETQAGMCFGNYQVPHYELEPFMHYALHLSENSQKTQMLKNLRELSEEEPLLHIKIEDGDHITVSLMGEVQIEILKELIKDRFGEEVTIDSRQVAYKETITKAVEGVGHFEPLRHYAEVHLLLEPGEKGSGLQFENACESSLSPHYQRLIMTHLQEVEHVGVLTGSPITDMKITLLGGRSHEKHTEGGDFREATYRAVRQGLMMSESKLLEPYEHYEITMPSSLISKVFYDFEDYGVPAITNDDGTQAVLSGSAPVSFLYDYQLKLLNMTKGSGQISFSDPFYDQVLDEKEVIDAIGYHPEDDLLHPAGSIFCKHGAGYHVPYDEVYEHMHLPLYTRQKELAPLHHRAYNISDEEVKRVYENTYGKQERKLAKDFYGASSKASVEANVSQSKPVCLLVDGYNVIFAWDKLKKIAQSNLGAARDSLIDIMASYQGYKGYTLILVFDAYKVEGQLGSLEKYHNIYIVYTKEAQTADAYIEKATKHLSSEYRVMVATSDNLEQKIVVGHGALRLSSRELLKDVEATNRQEQEDFNRRNPKMHNTIMEDFPKE